LRRYTEVEAGAVLAECGLTSGENLMVFAVDFQGLGLRI